MRVEAGRLRSRLKEYYDSEGLHSTLRIEVPKGSYIPVFQRVTLKEPESPEQPSLAVLPFANMTAEPDNDYLSDGLTEECDRPHICFSVQGQSADAREVGARLNVRALLDGSVRKTGNRLRINVQLIGVSNGCQLWSHQYECEMKDVFAVQDEITGMVVDALRVRLVDASIQVAATSPAPNIEAYNLYLKGRYQQARRTPEGLHKSIANFQEAIALDSQFAAAYCGLSESYSIVSYNELLPPLGNKPKRCQSPRSTRSQSKYVLTVDIVYRY